MNQRVCLVAMLFMFVPPVVADEVAPRLYTNADLSPEPKGIVYGSINNRPPPPKARGTTPGPPTRLAPARSRRVRTRTTARASAEAEVYRLHRLWQDAESYERVNRINRINKVNRLYGTDETRLEAYYRRELQKARLRLKR